MMLFKTDDAQDRLLARLGLLSIFVLMLCLSMIPSLIYALIDGHHDDRLSFLVTIGSCGLISAFTYWRTREKIADTEFNHIDGLTLVTLTWLVAGVICALPYFLYAHLSPTQPCVSVTPIVGTDFCSFTNSFFESMSGLTTTGASVITTGLWDTYTGGVGYLSDGSLGLPRGIMLWRCTTHLLGGLGIIVLGVAILPLLGVGGMQLFKAEAPGPKTDKLAPKMKETAKLLWVIYGGLTGALILIFWISGAMDFFESFCHGMSTMATGGFSTRSSSVAGFQSPLIEWVITVFMFLAGASFNLHFFFYTKRSFKAYLENVEFRVYSLLVLCTGLAIAIAIVIGGYASGIEESLRIALFQVLAIVTTTGYASANFELWVGAPVALMILVILMFCGGCAGSTGGGMKVIRHILLVKVWAREFFYLAHPTGKKSIRSEGQVVSPEIIRATLSFMGLYIFLMGFGCLAFTLMGHDLSTAFTCSASSIGNVGPGLGDIGPMDNYAVLTDLGKWLSAFLMLLGRLEIYTVLVLLTPSFWRR